MRGLTIAVMIIAVLSSVTATKYTDTRDTALVYYIMNQSGTILNSVTSKINLTCSVCPSFQTGSNTKWTLNYTINFTNSAQNLTATSPNGRLARNQSGVTIAFWFKSLNNATGSFVQMVNKNSNRAGDLEVWHNNAGTQNILIYHNCNAAGSEYITFTRNSFNTLGGWNHVAMVFNRQPHSNNFELWVNGVNATFNTSIVNTTGTCTNLMPLNHSRLILGNGVGGSSKLMLMDEVGIYRKALNTTQIRDVLYANKTLTKTLNQYPFGSGPTPSNISMNTCDLQVDTDVLRLWSNATHSTGANIRYNYTWFANGSPVANGSYPNVAVSWRYKNLTSNITNSKAINTWGASSPAKNMTDGRNYTYASTSGAWLSGNMYLNYSLPNNNSVSWINLTYSGGLVKFNIPDACYFVNKSYANFRVDSSNNPTGHIQVHCCLDSACAAGLTLYENYTSSRIYEINVITRTISINPSSVTAHNKLVEIGNYTPHLFTYYYGRCQATDANVTVLSAKKDSSTVYIPQENLCIYDEMTLKKMSLAGLVAVRLDSFCANKTERFNITVNCTNYNLSCTPEYQKLWFIYNSTVSYYRSMIPANTLVSNVTWYMIDLFGYTAVLLTNKITDLTGQYARQPFIVYKNTHYNGTITIFSQPLDLQNQVLTYLVKDETYSFAMRNNLGVTRIIGNIEADQANTKLITLPPITFNPDSTVLAEDVTITDYFNCSQGVWRLSFNDAGQYTDFLNISLYNGSSHSLIGHITLTPPNSYSAIFTVNNLNCNETYYSAVQYCNDLIGCQPVWRKSYGGQRTPFDLGFLSDDPATQLKIKSFISAATLIGIVLLIPGEFAIASIGLMAVAIGVFWTWGWLGWGNYLVISMFGLFMGIEAFRLVVRNR